MDVQEHSRKWVKALNRSQQYFKRAVLDNRNLVIDSNIAQLEGGFDSLGNFLKDYASDTYAEFKQVIGSKAPFGIADLKLTGDFYAGFVLKYIGSEFIITSTDWKTEELAAKYGVDIFGLANESIEQVRPFLLESWIKHLRNGLL